MAMRHLSYRERNTLSQDDLVANICDNLDTIQQHCHKRALDFQQQNTKTIDSKDDFYAYFADKNKDGNGFALAHWNGSAEIETQIKKDLKVTIRCIPMGDQTPGICPFSGEHSPQRVIWAKSY